MIKKTPVDILEGMVWRALMKHACDRNLGPGQAVLKWLNDHDRRVLNRLKSSDLESLRPDSVIGI